jgi:hypothetical protein
VYGEEIADVRSWRLNDDAQFDAEKIAT